MIQPRDKYKNVLAFPGETLEDVLPRMDKAALQVLLVVDENLCLLGTVTDGDVRRVLLRKADLKVPLAEFMYTNPTTVREGTPLASIRKLMMETNLRHIPIVDRKERVVGLHIWKEIFSKYKEKRKEKIVIMAGGKGTRLDPFTKILPKPMIPLGDKPILEIIMEKFNEHGFYNFLLSIGYKGEIIRLYFNETNNRPYNVQFIQEKEPLGTAGALGLAKDSLSETFIVTNADIIVDLDYEHLLEYHRENENSLTIVGALREFTIPYGVLKTEGQSLVNINEKPNFHYLVNTGIYVLEPQIVSFISENRFLDMTDLITMARKKNLEVGVYPHHGKWFDVGQWEEYHETLKAFNLKR
ncbi:MAG: CBS domain-containing protein [Firmicutes bacterium]|nr:CBS domain-containing protein [Bacillota bacterium]